MGLHEVMKLLHYKGNPHQCEETPEKEWDKIFSNPSTDKVLKSDYIRAPEAEQQ